MGYETYESKSQKKFIHYGRYFYGGFSYEFEKKYLNKFRFQISNSNREMKLDIPYISAATAGNIYYDWTKEIVSSGNLKSYFGFHLANDFNLNFFPKIDSKNFSWFNQTFIGVSSINKYMIGSNSRIDFNIHIPIISTIFYNKLNRLTSKIPGDEPIKNYSGFSKQLFNADSEIGYIFSREKFSWGIYYQLEINKMGDITNDGLQGIAHSGSIRIIY